MKFHNKNALQNDITYDIICDVKTKGEKIMGTFSPEKEKQMMESLKQALIKAEQEGQPVRRLAEELAQGGKLQCEFVAEIGGREQLIIWLEEE